MNHWFTSACPMLVKISSSPDFPLLSWDGRSGPNGTGQKVWLNEGTEEDVEKGSLFSCLRAWPNLLLQELGRHIPDGYIIAKILKRVNYPPSTMETGCRRRHISGLFQESVLLFLGVLSCNMRKEMGVMILDSRCVHRQTTYSCCTSAPHLVKAWKWSSGERLQ